MRGLFEAIRHKLGHSNPGKGADEENGASEPGQARLAAGLTAIRQLEVDALLRVDSAPVKYATEVTVIEGIVSQKTQGRGGRSPEGGYAVQIFRLAAWRRLDGPVQEQDLIVLLPVDPDLEQDFAPVSLSAQSLTVLLSTTRERAVCGCIEPLDPIHAELVDIARRLAEPVIVDTEDLGRLTFDPEYEWYEGKPRWLGQEISLQLSVEEGGSLPKVLAVARQLWADQESWQQRLEKLALEVLLERRNEIWLQEDEPLTSAESFVDRMKLYLIPIAPDGTFEFWFDADEMFGENPIILGGTIEDGLTSASP